MTALQRPKRRILIVEDEAPIRELLARYLREQGFHVITAENGSQALEVLSQSEVDLVLSDLRMPGMDGLDLLRDIPRRRAETAVVMLTGCEDVAAAVSAMKAGALDYVLKPFRLEEIATTIVSALERRDARIGEARRVRELETRVHEQSRELRRVLSELHCASEFTLEALTAALDARERETHAHSQRVGEITVRLARMLRVDESLLVDIRRGAMLHDIGKIGVSDAILLKPGALTEAEWVQMREHPQIGYWILDGIEPFGAASEIVLSHHERYEGMGYPNGLSGDAIPIGARIFAVADTLDAITSDRPYHRGRTYEEARREIAANAGGQFDPLVVNRFLDLPASEWNEIRSLTEVPIGRSQVPGLAPLVLS